MEIDLRHLRHALALAEHRHFGRAARSLQLTQPALSRSIARLERQAGTRLFERSSAGVEPTDAGHLLLERATELLASAANLGREIESVKGLGAGELHVGAGTYPAELLVGPTMGSLLRQYPAVRARVVVDNVLNLIPLLRRRDLDLVIGDASQFAKDSKFQITPLAPRQGYFIGRSGHPLLERAALTLASIMEFPLVTTSRLTPRLLAPFVRAAGRSGTSAEANPRSVPAIACESLSMMKAIVASSDAVGILPLGVVVPELTADTLALIPLVEPWLQGNFALVRLARRQLPLVGEKFWQLLLEADAELTVVTQKAERTLLKGTRKKTARPRRAAR